MEGAWEWRVKETGSGKESIRKGIGEKEGKGKRERKWKGIRE